MENITKTTEKLIEHREYLATREDNSLYGNRLGQKTRHKWQRNPETFARWRTSLHPNFYVYYRVKGAYDFKANPKVQIRLPLMPCLVVENTEESHEVFNEAYAPRVFIHKVEAREGKEWISVFGTIGNPTKRQIFAPVVPKIYDNRANEILSKVYFPSYVDHITPVDKEGEDTYDTKNGISNLRFHRFHLRFWPGRDKNYGVIDRMWDEMGGELPLSLPPLPEFEPDDIKENYPFGAEATKPIPKDIDVEKVTGLLDDFLSSKPVRTRI